MADSRGLDNMKLHITVQPKDNSEDTGLDFDVPIADKHVNILKESGKLIYAITQAIQNIKGELRKD
jgi:hypothetical protein